MKNNKRAKNSTRGYTLLELMVAVSGLGVVAVLIVMVIATCAMIIEKIG